MHIAMNIRSKVFNAKSGFVTLDYCDACGAYIADTRSHDGSCSGARPGQSNVHVEGWGRGRPGRPPKSESGNG